VIVLNPDRTPLFPDGSWLVGRYLSAPAITALLSTELYIPAMAPDGAEAAMRLAGYSKQGLRVKVMGGSYRVRDEHQIAARLMYVDAEERPVESFKANIIPAISVFGWGEESDPVMQTYLGRQLYVFCNDPDEGDPKLPGHIELRTVSPRGPASVDLVVPVTVSKRMSDGSYEPVRLLMSPNPSILEPLRGILQEISTSTVSTPHAAPGAGPAEA
jgi:hypothetical protein